MTYIPETEKFVKLWSKLKGYYKSDYKDKIYRYSLTNRPEIFIDFYKPLVNEDDFYRIEDNHIYFPVVRYESYDYHSPDNYFKNKNDIQYCGKFFYFEPQSSIYLDMGNTKFFASKHSCAEWLRDIDLKQHLEIPYMLPGYKPHNGEFFDEDEEDKYSVMPPYTEIMDEFEPKKSKPWWLRISDFKKEDTYDRILPYYYNYIQPFYNDLTHKPKDIKLHNIYGFDDNNVLKPTQWTIFYPSIMDTNQLDIPYVPGNNDRVDQYICFAGKSLGFDTFLFQHEVGEYRAVTEIMDLRDTPHKFMRENLETYENNTPFKRLQHPVKHLGIKSKIKQLNWTDPYLSTIWFPSDGKMIGKNGKIINEQDEQAEQKPAHKKRKKTKTFLKKYKRNRSKKQDEQILK